MRVNGTEERKEYPEFKGFVLGPVDQKIAQVAAVVFIGAAASLWLLSS